MGSRANRGGRYVHKEMNKREKYLIRLGLITGLILGILIGITLPI